MICLIVCKFTLNITSQNLLKLLLSNKSEVGYWLLTDAYGHNLLHIKTEHRALDYTYPCPGKKYYFMLSSSFQRPLDYSSLLMTWREPFCHHGGNFEGHKVMKIALLRLPADEISKLVKESLRPKHTCNMHYSTKLD